MGPSRLLGEVDVRWRGRVERVFFELPEWSGSLTTVARQRFEQNVDLTSAETRMRQLFEDGEGIIRRRGICIGSRSFRNFSRS